MSMFNKKKAPETSSVASSSKSERPSSPAKPSEEPKRASVSQPLPEVSRRRLAARSSLSKQLEFEGNLRFTGTTTVDCKFRGNIDSEDTLIVGESGRVEGEIHAGTVEISGTVVGNIWASKTVKIHSGSEVTGDIETPTISMEEGVSFAGRCTRPPQSAEDVADDKKATKPEKSEKKARRAEAKEETPEREPELVGVSGPARGSDAD